METVDKIGKLEAIALFITIISNNIIINIPTILVDFVGTSAWVHVLYLTFICLVFILIICKFFKPFVDLDILDVAEVLGGKLLRNILSMLYIILFIVFSSMCLRYFSSILGLVYFDNTPLFLLIILILIPVVVANRYNLKTISGANLVLLPIIVFSIFVLFISAGNDFIIERLFPVLGYGAKETFFTQISNIFAFNVVSYLFFLKPNLKKEEDFKKVSVIAVVLCGLYLFFSVVTLLMAFAFITQTDETLSLYLLTRLISFGKFFQRVDAMFIFIWILTILSFLSLNVYIIRQIIKKVLKLESSTEIVYPITALLFSISLSFKDLTVLKLFARNIYRIYHFILVFILSFILLLFAYMKNKRKQGEHR